MPHRENCPCPACCYRRGEGQGQAPQLSIRVAPEIREYLLGHPDGARATVERLVSEDQAAGEGLSRAELARECESLRQQLHEARQQAEASRRSQHVLKQVVADREKTLVEVTWERDLARGALRPARHALEKFSGNPTAFMEPEVLAVVARGALNDVDAYLRSEPVPRARPKKRRA